MKRLVISVGGLLAVMYLSAMPPTTQRTPASQHSLAKTPGELLRQNKKVSDRLSVLLRPQNPPVTDLQAASQGFTSLGELFTAVHISQNIGIPFDQVTTAEQTNGSLGNVIHVFKPDGHVEREVRGAVLQALDDLDKTPGVLLMQNKKLSDALSALLRQQDPVLTDPQAASRLRLAHENLAFEAVVLLVRLIGLQRRLDDVGLFARFRRFDFKLHFYVFAGRFQLDFLRR